MRDRIINVDICGSSFKNLKYKQYDNNNILKIKLYEDDKEINISSYTARAFFQLPSKTILQNDCIIENNTILITLDNDVLSEYGKVSIEIALSNDKQIVTTFTIYIDVEKSINRNKAIRSNPQWDIILNVMETLDNKIDKQEGGSIRPIDNLYIGMQFFDTTLNKPIWYNGKEWVDAMGEIV